VAPVNRATTFFKALLKFGMPLSLLLVPLLAIYGWVKPWTQIQAELDRHIGQTPILIGASYQARHTTTSGSTVSISRSYVMVPGVFRDPKLVTFSQFNQELVLATESRAALVYTIFWWAICIVGTWWFWARREPPNNSFKPTSLRDAA
jgi:hypothetical protein